MKVRTIPAVKTLTDQQKYLLNRLPGKWDLKSESLDEPAEVKQARKVVEAFDEKSRKFSCAAACRAEKALSKAREAIYFKPIDAALAAVHEVEALKKCCKDY